MTDQTEHPDPGQLLPHSGRMNLLGSVLEHDSDGTRCRFTVERHDIFYREEGIPSWFGIEYLGQCSFLHHLLKTAGQEEARKNALFLGGKNISFSTSLFRPGQTYHVFADDYGIQGRYYSAEGWIRLKGEDENLVEGRLNALLIEADESLTGSFNEQIS